MKINQENKVKKIPIKEMNKHIVIFTISIIVIISTYIFISNYISSLSKKYTVVNEFSLMSMIETLKVEDNNVIISGWAINYEFIAENIEDIQVFLVDNNSQKEYWLDVNTVERSDVVELYGDNFNHLNSGFEASIETSKIDLDNSNYTIFIKLNYYTNTMNIKATVADVDTKTFFSGYYLSKGKLINVDPDIFINPETTQSEGLNEIINNGRLCSFISEYGMYIYEYQGSLYYISSNNFLEVSSVDYFPLKISPQNVNDLPDVYKEYGVMYRDFYLNEVTFEFADQNRYSVFKKEIQLSKYRFIETGICDLDSGFASSCVILGQP